MSLIKCSVLDCKNEVVARGLCRLHYERLTRGKKGTTDDPRPTDWGKRTDHPLYGPWRWMARSGKPMCKEWLEDFWQFVKDVGERPSEKHKCFRIDENLPYGPKNFFWREVVFKMEHNEEEKAYHARYLREYYKLHPDRRKEASLKKHFGITLAEYNAMLEAQNGVCAICGQVDKVIDKRTGEPRRLAVDHCHAKGHVRALLCQRCNQGLGNFRDDPVLLRTAADYLERAQWIHNTVIGICEEQVANTARHLQELNANARKAWRGP